ncbi:MAG: SusC/RagA family TonB-linked outer membrane protein [Prevotella sp.]|nr:SusC/RagA family TonB-linked outer membrane protein [Prevotella sp.]
MKTNKIKYLLLAAFAMVSAFASAQGIRISGTVMAPDGPVMMCNVTERDANNRIVSASQTDINGNFSMEIKSTANKLQVSYIGYKTKTVPIGDKTVFDIEMEDQQTLKEVVVVAKKRFNHGGLAIPANEVSVASQTFNMSNVEGLAFTSADEALQGQIAGLDIVANSGNLGAGTSMRLRGVTSINGSAEPLIVVDDNIFDNPDATFDFQNANEETYASLLSINPQDIADIQVLKDAAATAIWGSRGANGVIQIRTKRGSRGATRIDYSLRLQASWQPKGYNLLNGDDYTMMLKEMYYNPSQSASSTTNINEINYNKSWAEYENWNNNTDWVDAVTQTGWSQYHYLTIAGGGEKANFRISAGYDHQNGTIIKQSLDRFSTKLALDYFVSDRITFRVTFPLTYTSNNRNFDDNILGRAQKVSPNMGIYRQNADGSNTNEYYTMLPTGGNGAGSTAPNTSSKELESIRNLGNPVAIANLAWRHEKTYRISPEFKLDYKLLGTDDDKTKLDYTGMVYMDIYASSTPKFWPGSLFTNTWTDSNYNRNENNEYNSLGFTTRHTLTFTPAFKNKDWYATMFGRWEMTTGNNNSQYQLRVNTPNDVNSTSVDGGDLKSMSTGNGQWRSMSALFNGHFSYKSRYSLGVSVRADGTTKFGDTKKWGYFPGVSARWNISDEKFMKWANKWLSMLSFRPSWGIVGNQPGSEYLQYARYATGATYGQVGNNDGTTYLEALQLNNLKWEKTTQTNLGGDFGFFNGLITGDFNYYYKKTRDLLMSNVRIPSTTGFSTLAWTNVGDMENKGWELNIEANKFINIGKFSMSANFNISQNFNKILAMDESVLESINSDWDASKRGSYLNRIQIGNPLGSIYGLRFKGVYQYTYEYLINMKERNNWSGEDLRNYINNEFLPSGKTAPIAIDNEGKVLMSSTGEPVRQVYNFKDGSSTYKFQGGDAIYEDINNDGQINSLDIVYLGNSNPKVSGGFGFNFFWGSNWSLKTSFSYRAGVKVVNSAKMGLEQMFNAYNQSSAVNWRWRKNGDVTNIPRAMFDTGYNFLGSDRYVEDASFIRMSYIQLVYNFDKKLLKALGMRRLQLSISGQNLFCWSKYSGTDPEHSAGAWGIAYDNSQTPRSKSVTMNINVGF